MQDLVLASNNAGKLREFGTLLAPLGWRVRAQREFGVRDAAEPFDTFVENALAKARHASAATGLAALADDSGICVPKLNGAPGVRSARFAGEPSNDARNNAALIARLQEVATHDDDWIAEYACVLVLVRTPHDPLPVIASGRWRGRLVATPRGAGGFGYDPHFLVPSLGRTAAELSDDDKHRLSHRGQAVRALLAQLQD
ncbi:MAG TPA: non-canonical purine NTP pyrophosphatase [Burkholderiaceae bacterium]|nr:non-canonical purine NTP pyrophosphatase [Burkholderiaceae bacterium]